MSQPKLNLIYKEIKVKKAKIKTIKAMYSDALMNHKEYSKVVDEFDRLKEKKKKIENIVKAEMQSEFETIDTLKAEIKIDQVKMTDIALKKVSESEDPNFKDEHDEEMEAVFSVKYKRA